MPALTIATVLSEGGVMEGWRVAHGCCLLLRGLAGSAQGFIDRTELAAWEGFVARLHENMLCMIFVAQWGQGALCVGSDRWNY